MFFCAVSMTASRSCSFCRCSVVCAVVFCSESPSRCETELEPLVDCGLQLRLAVAEHPDHGFEALPRGALRLRQLGHDGGLRLRWSTAAPEHDNERRDRGQSHDHGHNREDRQYLGHRVTLCDSQAT